jgi:hypothetical protein
MTTITIASRRALLPAAGLAVLAALAVCAPHALAKPPSCAQSNQDAQPSISDPRTGLIWQGVTDGTQHTFTEAQAYCAMLSYDGASAGKWRLPTIWELQTIVDETRHGPALDATFPVPADQSFHWSSTGYGTAAGIGMGVYFDQGNTGTESIGVKHAARCVR